ncbi:MAG: phosphatidylserine/phosphatidylglycerophosphate/cardiolipin synthase family protein [Deltaproteobacteria bacterium]|nr:phosphatidylserine/phosphatidylglycerophosphate/cardiolipin synthase family protein [Deltaproteobacteria bacterium]
MIRRVYKIIWLVALYLFLNACGATHQKREYFENITLLGRQHLETALLGDNEIQIRYRHGEVSSYLYASWQNLKFNMATHNHGLSEILFSKKPLKTLKNPRQIHVRKGDEWQALLKRAISVIAPSEQGMGVSAVLNYQEMALYRDTDCTIHLSKFSDTPPHIRVTGLLRETQIAAEIARQLNTEGTNEDNGQFLFRTDSIDHGGIAFMFIDLNRKQTVFLTTPYNPEYSHSSGSNPAMYMARWFYRSGLLTILKNPATTMYRLYCRLRHSAAVILTGSNDSEKNVYVQYSEAEGMDIARFEEILDDMFPHNRPFKGNINFLIDGDNFFPRLIQCLNDAKKSIWLRTYIFDNDDYAVKIADILKRRSPDIKVRVLADHMGCMSAATSLPSSPIPGDFIFPSDIFDYLEEDSKVMVRATTNPWFTADHTKTIIIDSNTAFIGGMNIGREYRYEWHDLMMEVRGPVVGRLKKDFRKAWSHAGPFGDMAYLFSGASIPNYEPENEPQELYDIRTLYTKAGATQIFDAQLVAIRNAKRYIYIQNPYFTENRILNELINARARGVDVRVILPSTSDYGFMDSSNIVKNIMLKNGIRVYQYPRISHIKAAIYDGWACLGSANFDALSLRINLETNLAFSDPKAVQRLKEDLFERDFAASREVTAPVKVTFMDYMGEMISNQL